MQELTITKPDDWHCHLRDDAALTTTVAHTAHCFERAIVMPNLMPPVTDVAAALAYRKRILTVDIAFKPLMTLYLTDNTTAEMIHAAAACEHVVAAKLYPAGATTNSASGVTSIEKIYPALEAMTEVNMPLLVHGEVTTADVDVFDREKIFIDSILAPLHTRYPKLKIVLEHITTQDAVEFVRAASDNVAATITVHHLLLNRNDMLVGGIKPDYYCLPILKRNTHQQALISAATSGEKSFFLGTDSAPHTAESKISPCGCAGVYSAPAAIELYAQAFEQANALNKLENFASHFGPDFYALSRNTETITLIKKPWQIPGEFTFSNSTVVPLYAGQSIDWQLQNKETA